METIWINITTDDGELVDRFAVWLDEQWSKYPDARVRLAMTAQSIRDHIERRFDGPEQED